MSLWFDFSCYVPFHTLFTISQCFKYAFLAYASDHLWSERSMSRDERHQLCAVRASLLTTVLSWLMEASCKWLRTASVEVVEPDHRGVYWCGVLGRNNTLIRLAEGNFYSCKYRRFNTFSLFNCTSFNIRLQCAQKISDWPLSWSHVDHSLKYCSGAGFLQAPLQLLFV